MSDGTVIILGIGEYTIGTTNDGDGHAAVLIRRERHNEPTGTRLPGEAFSEEAIRGGTLIVLQTIGGALVLRKAVERCIKMMTNKEAEWRLVENDAEPPPATDTASSSPPGQTEPQVNPRSTL